MHYRLVIPGDRRVTELFCADHFVTTCQQAVRDHGLCCVALAGGSTPRTIYTLICQPPRASEIPWDKIHLFWSDERAVPLTHRDSNYRMAMEAGFGRMPIPPTHIHPMISSDDSLDLQAEQYETSLRSTLGNRSLDLVILGMGNDGHTASLFPGTEALKAQGRYVVANYVPQQSAWRMTLTFEAITDAQDTVVYVLGHDKAETMAHVVRTQPHLPCQFLGSEGRPAHWILDEAAASAL